MSLKVIIVGGVAGGASTAARLRRLSEKAEIILLERGDYISYANCGLPYYIGGIIEERDALFVMTPQKFKAWLNVDVRVKNEALRIDRDNKEVVVIDHHSGEEYRENYDYLVLSPGAEPLRPPLPGIDSTGIFSLRSVPDTDRIYEYLANKNPRRAVVVGAGYIGLEMAENLKHRGLDTTIVELAPQVLSPIDADLAASVQQYLRAMGIKLYLGDGVQQFIPTEQDSLKVELNSGETLETDLIILAIGVKPETGLAREAGLKVERGIRVNEQMQTSDPAIYALGDAVEVTHLVTGKPAVIPLAGPANKQGRIAADNIAGRNSRFKGAQGTSVLKIFDMTVAATGANERILQTAGIDYHKVIIHPNSHAGYYPGATPLTLKLIFSPEGTILGAQAAGFGGVEKRIDVIAAVLRAGGTVEDLQELELSYAPPYSSAKDPVNMAGFVAGNILNGDFQTIEAEELIAGNSGHSNSGDQIQLLDVREPEENELGCIPGSLNIALGQLRERLHELDRRKEIVTYCSVGLRSYLAYRILVQNGFATVRGLNGGYRIYQALNDEAEDSHSSVLSSPSSGSSSSSPVSSSPSITSSSGRSSRSSGIFPR